MPLSTNAVISVDALSLSRDSKGCGAMHVGYSEIVLGFNCGKSWLFAVI